MMKKLLLSIVMAVSAIFASAQVIIPVQKGESLLKKSTEKIVLNNKKAALDAPKKVASLDNTTLWGYYLGNIADASAVGVGAAATYYAGMYVPGDGILKGSSINGVNLPIYTTANMTNVSVWISEDLETNIVTKDVDVSTLKEVAYNAIALDEPYAIPEEGIFIGVKFTITKVVYQGDAYPIFFGDDTETNSLVMKFSTATGGQNWADYSDQFGSYAMQLFCSNLSLTERSAYFKSASGVVTLPGEEVNLPVVISSDGSEGVSSIDYAIEINGNKTTKHLDLASPIAGGFGKKGNAMLSFTAPEAPEAYTTKISIEKVNGKDNEASSNVLSVTNKVVSKIVARRTVVEEFTGTGCGWCPRGWAGMELMKETKENFIGIAFHQFNSSDPMYVANYYSLGNLGINGAPGCAMDRKLLGIDPYYGSSYSILDDFDYCNALIPDVDVKVSGTFNKDLTAVDIKADVEYLTSGANYTVAYVLTADSLSGTTSAWRQANYYASYGPEGDPLIDQFCSGGKNGSSYIFLTFNDVMIGSSYSNSGINLASALQGDTQVGSIATGSYTVKMPTATALKNAIHTDEVYAVALVIASDGTIANAARAKVVTSDDTDGIISKTDADSQAHEVARYNAAGQIIGAPQKGLNIIKMSNGKVVKTIVK